MESFEASVLFVEDPGRFFCRRRDEDEAYRGLKDRLNLYYGLHGESLLLRRQERDPACEEDGTVVVFFEGCYMRAQILPQQEDEEEVGEDGDGGGWRRRQNYRVFLLDRGQIVTVPSTRAFAIASEFSTQPRFAIRCHLSDVTPAAAPSPFSAASSSPPLPSTFWSTESAEVFRREVGVMLSVQVTPRRGEELELMSDGEMSLPVEVFIERHEAEDAFQPLRLVKLSMSQILLREKLAYVSPLEDLREEECCSEDSTESEDDSLSSAGGIDDIGGFEQDDNWRTISSPFPPKMLNYEKEKVFAVEVSVLTDTDKPDLFVHLKDDRKALDRMRSSLSVEIGCEPPAIPRVGAPVAVRYSADGFWYRAYAISPETAQGMVELRYADYGHTEVVKSSGIKALPKEFLNMPEFAVKVRLPYECNTVFATDEMKSCLKLMKDEMAQLFVVPLESGTSELVGDLRFMTVGGRLTSVFASLVAGSVLKRVDVN